MKNLLLNCLQMIIQITNRNVNGVENEQNAQHNNMGGIADDGCSDYAC